MAEPPGSAAQASSEGEALFLDFDGTLVELAERPEAVTVHPDLPAILTDLRSSLGGAVAIVTGRAVASVEAFLPGLGLDILGLHGLERRIGGRISVPGGLADLGPEVAALRARFAGHSGIVIEDKRIGVAVHWRLAPNMEAEARSAVAELGERLGPAYRIQDGKAVREILPAFAGKGGGIRAMMERPPYRGRRPVFAGDDRTDESGFEVVNEAGGMSIKIGAGPSAALDRIASPAAFRSWLAMWRDTGKLPPLPSPGARNGQA